MNFRATVIRSYERVHKLKYYEASMISTSKISHVIFAASVFLFSIPLLLAQGSYRAQVRGTVADSRAAVVRDAKVTITEAGTNISSSNHTNEKGEYIFTGLRPSTYSLKVELQGELNARDRSHQSNHQGTSASQPQFLRPHISFRWSHRDCRVRNHR